MSREPFRLKFNTNNIHSSHSDITITIVVEAVTTLTGTKTMVASEAVETISIAAITTGTKIETSINAIKINSKALVIKTVVRLVFPNKHRIPQQQKELPLLQQRQPLQLLFSKLLQQPLLLVVSLSFSAIRCELLRNNNTILVSGN